MARGFYLGNELIAAAAKTAGASSAYAYPGTPSSEILSSFMKFAPERYAQWSLNEKIACELASAAAISGGRSMCAMKQVGLNVAADPLFSAAYTGVSGALVIVSADDPGPHSSQTEQDSRMYAVSAKIPVFDPSTPADAFRLTLKAFETSEKFGVPVMVRPVMRVCHARESFEIPADSREPVKGTFVKNPDRWAATPKHRAVLHAALKEKLLKLSAEIYSEILIPALRPAAVVASGYCAAVLEDARKKFPDSFDVIKIDMPYPADVNFIKRLQNGYEKILVLEETFPVFEKAFENGSKIYGKISGHVPDAGEFGPVECEKALASFLGVPAPVREVTETKSAPAPAKPRLCAGCGHRGAFYAIKRGAPGGIFPGDIGCYTLGTNLDAVDTCICMGASISFAESLKRENPDKPVICTIGDSTFFHAGLPALLNAQVNSAPVVVAVLDNETTAMTGFQPVPHADGRASIIDAARGLGIKYIAAADPYDIPASVSEVRKAVAAAEENRSPALLIFKRECVTKSKAKGEKIPVVTARCTNCSICYDIFECPAIGEKNGAAFIDRETCSGCGCCVSVCPRKAITEGE